MAPQALAPAGGDQPHNNMMPYLTLNFCIALQGVFPPRIDADRERDVALRPITPGDLELLYAVRQHAH